jgi:hypothetical protein
VVDISATLDDMKKAAVTFWSDSATSCVPGVYFSSPRPSSSHSFFIYFVFFMLDFSSMVWFCDSTGLIIKTTKPCSNGPSILRCRSFSVSDVSPFFPFLFSLFLSRSALILLLDAGKLNAFGIVLVH